MWFNQSDMPEIKMMSPETELNAVGEKERANWKWVLDPCFIENSISVNI